MDKATSEKVKVFTTDYVEFLEEHVGLQHVYTDLLGGSDNMLADITTKTQAATKINPHRAA